MKTRGFNFHLIWFFMTFWLLSFNLAVAQAPNWAPSEGYSYVTKSTSQQWLKWSDVGILPILTDVAYEHETVFLSADFVNRKGGDDENPAFWWSNLPAPYRDTTSGDQQGIAGCEDCDNFAIGSADAEKIQTNTWYRTIDWLVDENVNRTTVRVLINGQIVQSLIPGCNWRWCFVADIDTYGLTLWRAPVKVASLNGDLAPHYTTATGNTRDTQGRKDIITAAERDARFIGSMTELWSNLNWSSQWELRRMGFEFIGQPLGTALLMYQATHIPGPGQFYYADPLRYTKYYDPAKQAWTPWYKEGGIQ